MLATDTVSLDLTHPLTLQRSLRRSWVSFNRTAGRFVIFMLIVEAISQLSTLLVQIGSTPQERGGWPATMALISLVSGLSLTVITHWWMTLGLFRGACMALSGDTPRLADLLRWDGPGLRRWMAMWFLLLGTLSLLAAASALSHGALLMILPSMAPVPLLIGGLLTMLLLLSQLFCLPLVVLESVAPLRAFRLGVGGLLRHPGDWILLWILQMVPWGLMLLSQGIAEGLVLGIRLVTLPLAMSILTAAYLDCRRPESPGSVACSPTPIEQRIRGRNSRCRDATPPSDEAASVRADRPLKAEPTVHGVALGEPRTGPGRDGEPAPRRSE